MQTLTGKRAKFLQFQYYWYSQALTKPQIL